jgi:hypothetical protein
MKTRPSVALATALAILLGCAPAASAQEKKLTAKVTETSFGKLLPGKGSSKLVFSADGQHAGYVVQQADACKAVVDGKVVFSHEWIPAASLVLSERGGHFALVTHSKDGMRVVVDGVEQKPYFEVGHPVLSPDGKRHMYWAKVGKESKGQVAVVDGVASTGEFEKVRSPRFTADGKRFAFAAQREGKWLFVLDWAEGKPYDQVGPIEFAKDGSRWGHKAERNGKAVAVIDGQEQAEHDKVGGIAFSDDGKRVAYAAATGKWFYIVADGKVLGEPPAKDDADQQMVSEPVFSPDGKRLAYVTAKRKMFTVVADGQPGDVHDVAGDVQFSADSKHVVYRARDEKLWRVVVDGKPGKPYDATGPALVSPDGSRVAYAAKDGTNNYLVINEAEHPGDLNVSMSPSGKYVAHAMEPKEIARLNTNALLVNGQEVHSVKGILRGSKFVWDGDKRFYAMTGKDLEVIRLDIAIEE